MIKVFQLFIFSTLSLYANEDPSIVLPWILGYIVSIVLFFWGIYKAIKTQKSIYLLAFIPFLLLMIGMFFI
jgi:hypothetical protein